MSLSNSLAESETVSLGRLVWIVPLATAVGSFHQGERWAWLGLCSVSLVLILMSFMMLWTMPVLIVPLLFVVAALAASRGHLQE